jgi:hypothetical protein
MTGKDLYIISRRLVRLALIVRIVRLANYEIDFLKCVDGIARIKIRDRTGRKTNGIYDNISNTI